MTGNRESDFKNANKAMGFKNKPKGYAWHHLDDYNFETNTCIVELVRSDVHMASNPHGVLVYNSMKFLEKSIDV